jgi:hypothetical protein
MTLRILAIAVLGLLLTAFVQATPGTPLSSIPIGLEGIPGGLATARTDGRGQVVFNAEAGSASLLLPAVQACREAARRSSGAAPPPGGVIARVEVGRTVLTSAPLKLDGEGRAYFTGRDGRRLTVAIPRGGAPVRVTITGCCWAADPRGPSAVAPAMPAPSRR